MESSRAVPWCAEQQKRPGCRMQFGRRNTKRGPVVETEKRSSRPRKGWRGRLSQSEEGAAADRQPAKAGCRHFPGLKPRRGWSWLVCPWRRSGSFRCEQHVNRACEDAQVQKQAPVLDVGEIKVHVEFKRWTTARGNLPKTGDAGFYVKAPVVLQFVLADLGDGMRPRPDQAHLPVQHIPELRKFVEAVAAENMADASDSGIVVDFEDRALPLIAGAQILLQVFGVGHHGAKLVATEGAAFDPGAFGGINHRTGRVQVDKQSDDRHERTDQRQDECGPDDIYGPLQKQGGARQRLAVQGDDRYFSDVIDAGVGPRTRRQIGHGTNIQVVPERDFGSFSRLSALAGKSENDFVNEFGASHRSPADNKDLARRRFAAAPLPCHLPHPTAQHQASQAAGKYGEGGAWV